jgi:hypothetical protein
MESLRGLPLIVLMIVDHYETLWGRPVTSDEVAFALFPVASLGQIALVCRTLTASDHLVAVRDGWHCTRPLL